MTKLYFLDFEASSLDNGSFPIEVAWVNISGQGESYLIKPDLTWTNWSASAEKLHGITREQLEKEGVIAEVVAKHMWNALKFDVLCSDNPAFDQAWLRILLNLAGLPPIPVIDFYSTMGMELARLPKAFFEEGRNYAIQQSHAEALRQRTRHRALADAEGLWWRWKKVREWVEERLKKS